VGSNERGEDVLTADVNEVKLPTDSVDTGNACFFSHFKVSHFTKTIWPLTAMALFA
jgi:hypothetical protein